MSPHALLFHFQVYGALERLHHILVRGATPKCTWKLFVPWTTLGTTSLGIKDMEVFRGKKKNKPLCWHQIYSPMQKSQCNQLPAGCIVKLVLSDWTLCFSGFLTPLMCFESWQRWGRGFAPCFPFSVFFSHSVTSLMRQSSCQLAILPVAQAYTGLPLMDVAHTVLPFRRNQDTRNKRLRLNMRRG